MDNLKRKPNNVTQANSVERALSAFLTDNFVRNALFINTRIHAGIAVFGILTNVLNIVVFVKQGFKDTVNISLTSLAVSDLASLVFLAWTSLCNDPGFIEYVRHSFDSTDMSYLIGALPRTYVTLAGSWITSLVSAERCISVIRPLHVKFLFTKRRLVFANAFIFIAGSGSSFPLFYASRLTTKVDPESNRTYVGLAYRKNHRTMNFYYSSIALVISVCTFVIVCACATVIILTLAKQNKWRVRMTHDNSALPTAAETSRRGRKEQTNTRMKDEHKHNEPSKSNKKKSTKKTKTGSLSVDNRATKTVTLIAVMFIICYLPGTVNRLAMAFVPEYSRVGPYSNVFKFFWSVSFTAEAICSSANVFVYVGTNTKFRETIANIFRWCCDWQVL